MKEETFSGIFAAIIFASFPGWACALVCAAAVGQWSFLSAHAAFGALFWIPSSVITFIALWGIHAKCRDPSALLAAAGGVIPFAIVSTLCLIGMLPPVLDRLLHGSPGLSFAVFASLLLLIQGLYVAVAYVASGGCERPVEPARN